MFRLPLLVVICLVSVLSVSSQTVETDPWEPGEGNIILLENKDEFQEIVLPTLVLNHLALTAISYYQRSIASKSISRCPFEISCSQFAIIAIKKYGLLGYAIFIDRYFYRENISSYSLYIKKETKDWVIKLDDEIYLSPFK